MCDGDHYKLSGGHQEEVRPTPVGMNTPSGKILVSTHHSPINRAKDAWKTE